MTNSSTTHSSKPKDFGANGKDTPPDIASQLNRIEGSIARLSSQVGQLPGLVAIATDVGDETAARVQSAGINIDQRMQNLLQLIERLSSNNTLQKVDQLIQLTDRLPGSLAMIADVVDESIRLRQDQGFDIDSRIRNAGALVDIMTRADSVKKIEAMNKLADQLPGLVAIGADMFDEALTSALAKGYHPEDVIQLAGKGMEAMVKALEKPAKIDGIFSLFKSMRNPQVQKSLGFLMGFLQHFGNSIDKK